MQNFEITIIIVAYNPKIKLLEKIIETFHNDYPIIITNNSEKKLDLRFYSYNNVEIIDTLKNKGNGAGINTCLSFCKTKLALYLDIDAQIDRKNLQRLLYYSKKLKSYGALIPNNQKDILGDKCKKKIFKRWDVEGSVVLFNLENLKNQIFFDENIFLYFEENDFFFNCLKKNINVIYLKDVFISHQRASSINYENNNQLKKIKYLREWHYMWSSFYFYRKNFGFFYSLKKNLPLFFKDILRLIYFLISLNFQSANIRYSRIMGFINSFLNLRSSKRLKQ